MQSLIDIILDRSNHKHIQSVHLVIGELVDFSPDAFQSETGGRLLEHAQIYIRRVPAELQCMVCFGKYHPIDQQTLCPVCGSVGAKVLAGEECFVESIQTE